MQDEKEAKIPEAFVQLPLFLLEMGVQ